MIKAKKNNISNQTLCIFKTDCSLWEYIMWRHNRRRRDDGDVLAVWTFRKQYSSGILKSCAYRKGWEAFKTHLIGFHFWETLYFYSVLGVNPTFAFLEGMDPKPELTSKAKVQEE